MNKSILYKIGKEVLQKHPEIATSILSQISTLNNDVEKIPGYFDEYCRFSLVNRDTVVSKSYSQQVTETKRIFVSAMSCIYGTQKRLKKKISETLNQCPSATSRMFDEATFRYKKDQAFRFRVDKFLNQLENDNRAA